MRKARSIIGIIFLMMLGAYSYADETIQMFIGQDKVLKFESIKRVAVGSDIIAVNTLSSNEIMITAKKTGVSTLTIWDKADNVVIYTITIVEKSPSLIKKEVERLLSEADIEGISAKVVGENVILKGDLITISDAMWVRKVTSLYPQVINSTSLHRRLKETLSEVIKEMIGFKDVRVSIVKDKLLLEGTVPTQEDIKQVEKIASVYYDNIINLLKIGENLVEIEVKIVEVDRDKLKDFKPLQDAWQDKIDAKGVIKGVKKEPNKITFNASSDILPAVNMWITNGYATLLSEPKLVVSSGKEAEFLSGGEIPIVSITNQTSNVEYKKYGVNLKIKPVVDELDNIRVYLSTEVSSLDWSNKVSGNPGFLLRSAKSDLYIKKGESIIIAGLIHHTKSKFVKRVPILGYIPILNLFYSSKEERDKEIETIIIITPETKIAQKSTGNYKNIINQFGDKVMEVDEETDTVGEEPESVHEEPKEDEGDKVMEVDEETDTVGEEPESVHEEPKEAEEKPGVVEPGTE